MKMSKNQLSKVGDKVKFQENVPIKEGMNYQYGKIYDGIITKHVNDVITEIDIIGDDGSIVKVNITYDCFSSGMNSFELLISKEELEERKKEWMENAIAIEKAEYDKKVNYLKSIEFQ